MALSKLTISAHVLKLNIERNLSRGGTTNTKVLERYGITLADLDDSSKRFPLEIMSDLIPRASEDLDDPLLGLKHAHGLFRSYIPLGDYFGKTANGAPEFFALVARYLKLTTELGTFEANNKTATTTLTFVTLAPQLAVYHQIDGALLMAKEANEEYFDIKPIKVILTHPCPDGCEAEYDAFFQCEVNFSQATNAIVYSREDFYGSLAAEKDGLFELSHIEQLCVKTFRDKKGSSTIESVIFMIERILMHGEPSRNEIAKSLSMSVRTLQRKLAAEGSSYQSLLDQTRKKLAADYLVNTELDNNNIAILLGYSEGSQFYRAFRRWYSISPSLFKNDPSCQI